MSAPFARPAAGTALRRTSWTSTTGNTYTLLRYWPLNETSGNAVDLIAGASMTVGSRSTSLGMRGLSSPAYASDIDVTNVTILARANTPVVSNSIGSMTSYMLLLALPSYYNSSTDNYYRVFQVNNNGPTLFGITWRNASSGQNNVGALGGTQSFGIVHSGTNVTHQIGSVTVRTQSLFSHVAGTSNLLSVCAGNGSFDPYAEYCAVFAGAMTAADMIEFQSDPYQLFYATATSGVIVIDD